MARASTRAFQLFAAVAAIAARIACATSTTACSYDAPTASEDLSTSDLDVSATITDDGTKARISLELSGPGARVDLDVGEQLVVHAGSATIPLVATTVAGERRYVADLPDFSGALLLDLVRTHDRSVLGVELPVPPPFVVTAPTAPVSRDASLPLTWTNPDSGYTLSLDVKGTCAQLGTLPLAVDSGGYTVQAGELIDPADASGATCTATITIARASTTQGSFGGPGRLYVTAQRTRVVTVESTP